MLYTQCYTPNYTYRPSVINPMYSEHCYSYPKFPDYCYLIFAVSYYMTTDSSLLHCNYTLTSWLSWLLCHDHPPPTLVFLPWPGPARCVHCSCWHCYHLMLVLPSCVKIYMYSASPNCSIVPTVILYVKEHIFRLRQHRWLLMFMGARHIRVFGDLWTSAYIRS